MIKLIDFHNFAMKVKSDISVLLKLSCIWGAYGFKSAGWILGLFL